MKSRVSLGLAGAGLLALVATTAAAQSESSTTPAAPESWEVEEIVVSARRRDESLQDIPQTVDAVTSESIQKLNLLKFEDVQAVVPGLAMVNNSSGFGAGVSLRGVTFEAQAQTSSTVEFYMDDALIESNNLFQAMFDVGQVEVLRGPQGTLRGRAAPSGSITVTSRRPDLSEFGGYSMATGTTKDAYNFQGALNVPIQQDVLAVRVAGVYDENRFDHVRSVFNDTDPKGETKGGRISLAFQPSDALDAFLTYQRLERDVRSFNGVTGTGGAAQAGGLVLVDGQPRFPYPLDPTLPANFNGPALSPGDLRSVMDDPATLSQTFDNITANINYRVGGQRVSYVMGYRKMDFAGESSLDVGNLLPGVEIYRATEGSQLSRTHELRIASEERIAGIFDYTAGVFYSKQSSPSHVVQPAAFLSGALGSPIGAPVLGAYDPRYVAGQFIDRRGDVKEKSVFANVTWHITDSTELSVGGRYIVSEVDELTLVSLGGSPLGNDPFAVPALFALAGAGCTGLPVGTYGPGTCDLPAAALNPALAPRVILDVPRNVKKKPFIYNASLSHRFNDDFLAYANVGTSWRRGVSTLGINNGASPGIPSSDLLNELTNHGPEKSISYEIGMKTSWLDKRIRLNVAVYHQDFDGLIFRSAEQIAYLGNQGQGLIPSSFQFVNQADAVVDGIDLDATFQITPRWSAALAASYADGRVDDELIPCNDPNVTLTQAQPIALCESDDTISAAPQWSATLQSEYFHPITSSVDGYIRGLYTYYPENTRQRTFKADAHGLLNLYLGVRSPDATWDVSLFAKNLTNEKETLAINNFLDTSEQASGLSTYFGSPNYVGTRFTAPREYGLVVRYAFGSR